MIIESSNEVIINSSYGSPYSTTGRNSGCGSIVICGVERAVKLCVPNAAWSSSLSNSLRFSWASGAGCAVHVREGRDLGGSSWIPPKRAVKQEHTASLKDFESHTKVVWVKGRGAEVEVQQGPPIRLLSSL